MEDTSVEKYPAFWKIHRLNRRIVVTEKLDGTNALISIGHYGEIRAGSRTRWITPERDNYGFARWVEANRDELIKLGPGLHYGEWYGSGIQRGYGLKEKRFALFNTTRWATAENRPACCEVTPVLYDGPALECSILGLIDRLKTNGSVAVPGFMHPEGIVLFHETTGSLTKYTFDKNDESKGAVA